MLHSFGRNYCLDVRRCICTCLWVSTLSIPCLLGSAKQLLHNFTLSRLSLRRIAFLAHLSTYQQFLNLQTKFYVIYRVKKYSREISSFYFHPLPSLSTKMCGLILTMQFESGQTYLHRSSSIMSTTTVFTHLRHRGASHRETLVSNWVKSTWVLLRRM